MTFPDEPLELVECTKKCMTVSDRMSEPPSYVHCRYKSASGVELFSYCAVLDDRSAITSLYAYLRALIAAHIRRLQEKIGSGKMALVPLEKHAIQQFFTENGQAHCLFSDVSWDALSWPLVPSGCWRELICILLWREFTAIPRSVYILV